MRHQQLKRRGIKTEGIIIHNQVSKREIKSGKRGKKKEGITLDYSTIYSEENGMEWIKNGLK